MVKVCTYSEGDFPYVKALWEQVFPDASPRRRAEVAIPAKLLVQPDLFLVARASQETVGTVMAGYDGHRGWLYAVAVSPPHQRKGIGTALVREAERRLRTLGCEKVNLQTHVDNPSVAFYRRLGYDVEERVSMGKRFSD